MSRVVHAKANGNDEIVARYGINGEIPKMHVAHDIDKTQTDSGQNEDGGPKVGQQKEGSDENADNGKGNVAIQFNGNDFIGLPRRIAD